MNEKVIQNKLKARVKLQRNEGRHNLKDTKNLQQEPAALLESEDLK